MSPFGFRPGIAHIANAGDQPFVRVDPVQRQACPLNIERDRTKLNTVDMVTRLTQIAALMAPEPHVADPLSLIAGMPPPPIVSCDRRVLDLEGEVAAVGEIDQNVGHLHRASVGSDALFINVDGGLGIQPPRPLTHHALAHEVVVRLGGMNAASQAEVAKVISLGATDGRVARIGAIRNGTNQDASTTVGTETFSFAFTDEAMRRIGGLTRVASMELASLATGGEVAQATMSSPVH